MLEKIPSESIMTDLLGKPLYDVWLSLCLCSLYARNNCVGFMIIFGKDERTKFEESRESFSTEVQKIYDESKTYHDGKWVMFYPGDESLFSDFVRLLAIKRKPNKNQ